jgi:hypothetical protein
VRYVHPPDRAAAYTPRTANVIDPRRVPASGAESVPALHPSLND